MDKIKPMKRFAYITKRGDYPYIGLNGPWLEQAGFVEGNTVRVDIDHEELTIYNRAKLVLTGALVRVSRIQQNPVPEVFLCLLVEQDVEQLLGPAALVSLSRKVPHPEQVSRAVNGFELSEFFLY